jgi:hypothetical protein
MWEWLSNLSSLSVFIAVCAMGFLFLLFSFLFGEFFEEFSADHGADHDLGDGPGVFSLRTLSIFITGLGGLGAIASLRGAGAAVSASVGLAGGVALAGAVYGFARYLYRQQSSSHVTAEELINRRAEVTVAIPAGGLGQVRCLVGETIAEKIARSRDGDAIPTQPVLFAGTGRPAGARSRTIINLQHFRLRCSGCLIKKFSHE